MRSLQSDEQRIQAYLAGRLSEAESEAFEERLLADDELAAEVRHALEIRAATTEAGGHSNVRRGGPSPRLLLVLAAAAGMAALAVGLGLTWLQTPSPAPVFRGVEQRMGLAIEGKNGALNAQWEPVTGAAGYELRVLASDGRLLQAVEAESTAAALDIDAAATAGAYVEVVALDELGQTLRRSERLALPE